MARQGAHEPGQRIGDAGVAGDLGRAGILAAGKHDRGELDQRGRRVAGIAFEVVQARHRVVVEIEDARLEEIVEGAERQPELGDRFGERARDRMAAAIATERVAPPLQADLAERRLAHAVADARDLGVEGVEREEVRRAGSGAKRSAR